MEIKEMRANEFIEMLLAEQKAFSKACQAIVKTCNEVFNCPSTSKYTSAAEKERNYDRNN